MINWDIGTRVVFLHAHPDDETLSTGGLIAELGWRATLVTATRGEAGEAIGEAAALAGTPEFAAHREGELAGAVAALGVGEHVFLGSPPARAAGLPPRVYRDSGMVWVTPTLAGPSGDAGPDALASVPIEEPAADLAAFLRTDGTDALVSYDADGGYGHPDHVACHHIAVLAAQMAGVGFIEIVSPTRRDPSDPAQVELDLSAQLPRVRAALACHASQLTLDGDEIVHAGGQRQPIDPNVSLQINPDPLAVLVESQANWPYDVTQPLQFVTKEITTMNCPNCGTQVPAGTAFCATCGVQIGPPGPNTTGPIPTGPIPPMPPAPGGFGAPGMAWTGVPVQKSASPLDKLADSPLWARILRFAALANLLIAFIGGILAVITVAGLGYPFNGFLLQGIFTMFAVWVGGAVSSSLMLVFANIGADLADLKARTPATS